jgi:uncharacterized membrane protein
MINLHWLYVLAGAVFAGFAIGSARDETNPNRWGNAVFWLLLTASFWFGDLFGDIGNGILVLALVAIAGLNLIGRGSKQSASSLQEREESSTRHGNRLFLPALIIPFTAFVGTLLFNYTPLKLLNLIDPKAVTLVLLGCGVIIALVVSYVWLRPPAFTAVDEGSRLMNGVGWAAVLPQMLASLGVIFAAAGVGTTIGSIVGAFIPQGSGTLMTPMAANFNIVPAALLELKDQYGVIRVQVPTALALLAANILILYVAGFHM